MFNLQKRLYKSLPIVSAVAFFIAGLVFGMSRDFGVFLLGMIALPILLLVALGCSIFGLVRKTHHRGVQIAAILILATPVLVYAGRDVGDQLRFILWASFHYSQLHQSQKGNPIIKTWDSWGMAGNENDSYLVVDTKDEIGSLTLANRWRERLGQSCEIVATKRMWPKFYIVTTYECPFDGVMQAN